MKATLWKVLLVDDDEADFDLVNRLLCEEPPARFTVDWAGTFAAGLRVRQSQAFDVLLVTEGMRAGPDRAAWQALVNAGEPLPVVSLTGDGDAAEAAQGEPGAVVVASVPRAGLSAHALERALLDAIARSQAASLQQARQALADTRERYGTILGGITDGYCFVDPDWRIITVNNGFLKFTGHGRETITGRKFFTEFTAFGGAAFERRCRAARASGQPAHFVARIRAPRGEPRRVLEVYANPSTGSLGLFIRDITARAQHEQELNQLNRTLLALGQSSVAMMHARDEATYLRDFCRIITKDCGYALVWIGFAEHDLAKSVRQAAYAGFDEGYINLMKLSWGEDERGRGPTGSAIRSGEVALCRDMATDPAFIPWRDEALKRGYRSSIVLPLKGEGEPFGALSIYSDKVDGFAPGEISLLKEMANDLAYGINILRLRQAQAEAEVELARHQEWLRVTLASTGDGVIAAGVDGRVALMNRTASTLTGWAAEEAIGQPIARVLTLMDGDAPLPVDAYLALPLAAKPVPSHANHTRVIARDGREVPVEHNAAPILDDSGNILGVVVVIHDITEKRAMESVLEDERRQLSYLASFPAQNPNPMIEVTLEGAIRYANPAAQEIAERWMAEWLGDWPEVVALFKGGTATSRRRDVAIGSRFYQQVLLYFSELEAVRIYATDITQRRLAEQNQAASQHVAIQERNRLLAVMEALPVGVAILNAQGGQEQFNRHFEEIWGGNLPKINSVKDYKAYQATWADSGQPVKTEEWASARAVTQGETVTGQVMHIQRFDGSYLYVLNNAAPIYDDHGGIAGCVVAIMDITERFTMEEELRQAQERISTILTDITERSQSIQALEKRVNERTLELSTLLAVSDDLGSTQELEPLIDSILDQLSLAVPYTTSLVMLVSEDHLEVVSLREGGRRVTPARGPIPLGRFRTFARVIATRRLTLIEDLGEHPRDALAILADYALACQDEPPEMSSWLGVPLMVKQRAIGILCLGSPVPGAFTHSATSLVQGIANQSAVAIDNVRLYNQARDLAALNERQRLARELHDSVSQALYGISLGTHVAIASIERDKLKLREALDYILSLADTGLTEMRALIFDLRPESLAQEGLVSALQKQTQALQARRSIQVTSELGDEPDLPFEMKEVLYRVGLEAMNNAARHARPSRIEVTLAATPQVVELAVSDDGVGFDPSQAFPGHLGLFSMRERAAQIGGRLVIDSAPGQGTTIRLRVPLAAPAD